MVAFTAAMGLMVIAVIAFMLTKGAFWGGYLGLELLSTLIFMGGMGLVIASRDPLLISVMLLLLVKRVSYKPPLDTEYDYWSVRYDLTHM